MKAKTLFAVLAVAILAGLGGWWAGQRNVRSKSEVTAKPGERKIRFYQSPMHPWITSDKPGRCTICGMQLEPVSEEIGRASCRERVWLEVGGGVIEEEGRC